MQAISAWYIGFAFTVGFLFSLPAAYMARDYYPLTFDGWWMHVVSASYPTLLL